jgi:ERCC4-type nuclease
VDKRTPLDIVIDTREKIPWAFTDAVRVVGWRALTAGDYAPAGFEDSIAIERKSIEDLVNTVTHERPRFTEELSRLASMRFSAVVIEGGVDEILAGRYRSKVPGHVLLRAVIALQMATTVPFHFCGTRPAASRTAELMLIEGTWNAQHGDDDARIA